ncbi:hypothetical protein AB0B79_39530, partial [Streptomyces sp. NPDC039022]|uniref:hypothetical protein n=1 Tax=Streptomyces sp. NPDC039022 TaxID=3157091 RepID=UPI00340C1896
DDDRREHFEKRITRMTKVQSIQSELLSAARHAVLGPGPGPRRRPHPDSAAHAPDTHRSGARLGPCPRPRGRVRSRSS